MITTGNKKSFHACKTCKIETVATTGFVKGNMIEINVRTKPAPSILAASSSSTGTLEKYPANNKI